MKKYNLTIKTLIYVSGLSILTLLLLWFLQLTLLDYSYEKYQLKTIKEVANKIEKGATTALEIENLADKYDLCIQEYTANQIIGYNLKNTGCILGLNNRIINKYKKELVNNNELDYIELQAPNTHIKSIIYEITLDNNHIIFINSTLEDVGVVSKQLKSQFIYIIIILIVVSIIIAIFITKKLNQPILKIIDGAKELGKGNYNVKFESNDIKELDELASVLTVAASEMNKTDELRRDLLANVSHDLKTPLTMIKAYAEKVKDISYKDKTKMDKDLDVIIAETDRLNILVNDLLDISKSDRKDFELNIEEYDLVESLNDILKRYDIVIEKENYNFKLDIIDKAIIKADKAKMEQVIYNLINNAIEHTGDDLTILIELKKSLDSYILSITDTGKGIPKEEIPLVWKKYYKKDKNHHRNVIGSGIGLAIVKNILDKHNFKYGINSKINKGTTFYIKIHK